MKTQGKNGWSEDLEEVMKTKDSEDFMRLGHLAFKANKILAICGPLLTGTAASGILYTLEGSIESTIQERDLEKRGKGEMFEVNVALKLVAA
ncbi:hypothetical protein POTOM_014837 [Populus tomentosa]|uniref:Uncharacterized protein n=1 Tax=Populus tomentosa TaxID=118781 RepID=A0A8X8A220_POPTO|nr:hypothetical protein POTOM_014837 [Populus tomentosa]